jgi:hypothetical protein
MMDNLQRVFELGYGHRIFVYIYRQGDPPGCDVSPQADPHHGGFTQFARIS